MAEAPFGPDEANVADQRRDPDSLLVWMSDLIRRRRETLELGWGTWKVIESRPGSLFVHRVEWEDSTVIAAHNLGSRRASVTLSAQDVGPCEVVDDLLGDRILSPRSDGSLRLDLSGFGYRWLRPRPPRRRPRY
jgi:hypothetical protein